MSAARAQADLPGITILLSTFNGGKFLRAQLESFLQQTYQNWTLFWRDDGSSDDTMTIMEDFAASIGTNRCVKSASSGQHLGAAPSFLMLLSEVPTAQAVAFADQDDVWLPQKLQHAAIALTEAGAMPMLYCARQILVDKDLRGTALSVLHGQPPVFPASLTQNIANGNTLVMNRRATELVNELTQPEGTVHDWWSYIVVSAAGGKIVFDPMPQVLYRLHKDNLIGCARPMPARAAAAMRRGPRIFMTMMRRHADALTNSAARLSPQAQADLNLIQAGLQDGFLRRFAALWNTRLRRRTLLENLLFSYWFLTG